MSTPFSHSREVVYITTSQEANEELRLMSDRGYKVVGFDTESLPGDKDRHRGKIAVIQVSDAEKALVINVSHINQGLQNHWVLPPMLRSLLQDPQVKKVAISLDTDAVELHRSFGCSVLNCIELRRMAKTIDGVNYGQGTFDTGMSLELMVTKYLGITLPDKKKLAKSYWESCLTGSLVTYAANDSVAAYDNYNHLEGFSKYYMLDVRDGLRCQRGSLDTPWHGDDPNFLPKKPQSRIRRSQRELFRHVDSAPNALASIFRK